MSYTSVITNLKKRQDKIYFPLYVLKGDELHTEEKKIVTFDRKMTFKNKEDLENYLKDGMTEAEREEAREDHIAGDQP